jgi:hypothetical protein
MKLEIELSRGSDHWLVHFPKPTGDIVAKNRTMASNLVAIWIREQCKVRGKIKITIETGD